MDIFSPIVTVLLFVIILRLYYELGKEKKKNDVLSNALITHVTGEGYDYHEDGISDEFKSREEEFDKRIQEMREELGQVQDAYYNTISPTTVADVLADEVYNLSRDEIILLEQQMKMEDTEYAD